MVQIFDGRPSKGVKIVATRSRGETRVTRDWRGRIVRRESRTVRYALHPTKGWRRAGATEWKRS